MSSMVDELGEWLNAELERRSWSMSELGRRAGYSSTQVSNVINGTAKPTAEFTIRVANALDEDAVNLLRMAEILPALPPAASEEEKALYLFRQIRRPEQREAALRMLGGLTDHSAIPQSRPEPTSRMGVDATLQEFIRRTFRVMWEIAPSGERAAIFTEFIGELSREMEHQSTEPG